MRRAITSTVARAATALVLALIVSKPLVRPDITARAQASDQVWTDPDTRLMWAVKDSGPYEPPTYGLLRQVGAAGYCKNSSLAGFHDWRLPTIDELEKIFDKTVAGYHVKGGVIKPSGDPTGQNHYVYAQMNVWSQSQRSDQDAIWEFDFGNGSRMTTVGGMGAARALCVRGAPAKVPVGGTTSGIADMSKYVLADGITIPTGGPGAPRGSGVYFTTNEGSELPVSLQGNPALATLNYSGTMEAAVDGKLAGGTEKFKPTRIETSKDFDHWLKVVAFSIGKDGFLVVKDELGASYKIKVAPIGRTGTIEELKQTAAPPLGRASRGRPEDEPLPRPVGTAASRAAAPAIPRLDVIPVGGRAQNAKLIQRPSPIYPQIAKRARISGTVELSAIIAEDGHVDELNVVSGHPLLRRAALDAVKQWIYQPTLYNGRPVRVSTTIDVVFTLDGAPAPAVDSKKPFEDAPAPAVDSRKPLLEPFKSIVLGKISATSSNFNWGVAAAKNAEDTLAAVYYRGFSDTTRISGDDLKWLAKHPTAGNIAPVALGAPQPDSPFRIIGVLPSGAWITFQGGTEPLLSLVFVVRKGAKELVLTDPAGQTHTLAISDDWFPNRANFPTSMRFSQIGFNGPSPGDLWITQ